MDPVRYFATRMEAQRMKPWPVMIVVVVVGIISTARGELAGDIDAVLKDKGLGKVQVGVQVVRLGSSAGEGKVLYRYRDKEPRMPASNMKVLTTSAALDHFGGDFKFRTSLILRGEDVILLGDGDPTLGDVELIKKFGWNTSTVFKNWAEQLKKQGVTSVRNVIVDDSIFDQTFYHPNWKDESYTHRYSAEVGGLNFNANCIDMTVTPTGGGKLVAYVLDPMTRYVNVKNTCVSGKENKAVLTREKADSNDLPLRGQLASKQEYSITIHDPPMYAGTVLADVLAREALQVSGTVVRDRTTRAGDTAAQRVVAVHETPLTVVLARANKDSMNVYAESLCKRLGAATSGGQSGSWENGTRAVGAFLRKAGAEASEFKLDDGCGLSRDNRVSPNTMMHVLMYDFYGPNREKFVASLAVGGVDGTLDDRFKNELRGRVFAKTGYINNVSALSGFLKTKSEQWYAFSILMNDAPAGTNSAMKAIQEKIVKAIDANAR